MTSDIAFAAHNYVNVKKNKTLFHFNFFQGKLQVVV